MAERKKAAQEIPPVDRHEDKQGKKRAGVEDNKGLLERAKNWVVDFSQPVVTALGPAGLAWFFFCTRSPA